MTLTYALLGLAIVVEVVATLLLKSSAGWAKWQFGMASVFCYAIAGLLLGLVLKNMSVGLAYAVWSGAGIALVCVASVVIWGQRFDAAALAGIALIAGGVLLIGLKSTVVLQ